MFLGNKRTCGNHSNYHIVGDRQTIKDIPGDLRWFPVTQKPVKDHQLKLMWKTCWLCCPGGPQNKSEGKWKKDKYLDLVRELKKLWNMKLRIVPIVIGALGTVSKGLLKGMEDLAVSGRVETIQTTALLRTSRILRRVLETWGELLSLRLQ